MLLQFKVNEEFVNKQAPEESEASHCGIEKVKSGALTGVGAGETETFFVEVAEFKL